MGWLAGHGLTIPGGEFIRVIHSSIVNTQVNFMGRVGVPFKGRLRSCFLSLWQAKQIFTCKSWRSARPGGYLLARNKSATAMPNRASTNNNQSANPGDPIISRNPVGNCASAWFGSIRDSRLDWLPRLARKR
jgi:hypothetical protein